MSGKNGQMKKKFNPKLEEYDKKLQMFYAEVCTKDRFFYNFVANIINKKLCIYYIWSLVMFLKFSNCTRLLLVQF